MWMPIRTSTCGSCLTTKLRMTVRLAGVAQKQSRDLPLPCHRHSVADVVVCCYCSCTSFGSAVRACRWAPGRCRSAPGNMQTSKISLSKHSLGSNKSAEKAGSRRISVISTHANSTRRDASIGNVLELGLEPLELSSTANDYMHKMANQVCGSSIADRLRPAGSNQ